MFKRFQFYKTYKGYALAIGKFRISFSLLDGERVFFRFVLVSWIVPIEPRQTYYSLLELILLSMKFEIAYDELEAWN